MAGVALLVCVACNLASPVVAGTLFELLVGRQAGNARTYGKVFAIMASLYIVEPLLTRIYIQNICTLSEKVAPPPLLPPPSPHPPPAFTS